MDYLRTPDSRFERLLDYPFEPTTWTWADYACITWMRAQLMASPF